MTTELYYIVLINLWFRINLTLFKTRKASKRSKRSKSIRSAIVRSWARYPAEWSVPFFTENCFKFYIHGSFHIRLTIDVADLNEIIFFGSLSTINRHVLFCSAKKTFFTSIRFFEFSKKWYFRHSKRTFKPVYLEKNCSHEKISKLWKWGFWLFFTEIVAKKLFKYFLTYKSKEINAKLFFPNLAPSKFCFFVDLDSLKSVMKYDDWTKMAGLLIRKLWNFEEPRAQSGRFHVRRAFYRV